MADDADEVAVEEPEPIYMLHDGLGVVEVVGDGPAWGGQAHKVVREVKGSRLLHRVREDELYD